MALTANSRFTGISITYSRDDASLYSVSYRLTDGTRGSVDLTYNRYPAEGSADRTELETLQTIWASTNGFRDASNNPIVPYISSFPHGTTPESLDQHGAWNPLRAGSYEDYLNRLAVGHDQARAITRSVDTEGHVTHTDQRSYIPAHSTPGTATMSVLPREEWGFGLVSGNNWWLRATFNQDEGLNLVNWDSSLAWRSLIQLLNDIRFSGDEISNEINSAAPDFDSDNPFPGRTFRFDLDLTEGGEDFQIFTIGEIELGRSLIPPMNITNIRVNGTTTTGTFNSTSYDAWLAEQSVTLASEAGAIVPVIGATDVPVRAQRFVGPDGVGLAVFDGTWHQRDAFGDIPLLGASGRVVTESDLPTRAGGGRNISVGPSTRTIHVTSATTQLDLHFPRPPALVSLGAYRELSIHNRSEVNVRLMDWNGNHLVTLRPEQRTTWGVEHSLNGTGELLLVSRLDRVMNMVASGQIGTLASGLFLNFDDDFWIRPIHTPTATEGTRLIDTDAFTLGNRATPPYTGGDNWTAQTDWFWLEAFRVEQAGMFVFQQTVDVVMALNATFPAGGEARLYRQRGTAFPELISAPSGLPAFGGEGGSILLTWPFIGPVQADDVFLATMLIPKTTPVGHGQWQIAHFSREGLLLPTIEVNYTP